VPNQEIKRYAENKSYVPRRSTMPMKERLKTHSKINAVFGEAGEVRVELQDPEDTAFVLDTINKCLDNLNIGEYTRLLWKVQLEKFTKKPQEFRWPISIIKHCILIKFYGEEKAYQMLRGTFDFDKENKTINDSSRDCVAILLPFFRTIQRFTASPSCARR